MKKSKEDWNIHIDAQGFCRTLLGIFILIHASGVVALALLSGLKVTVKLEEDK